MKVAFRSAAVLLVLFFLGHTLGGMIQQKSLGPAADLVFGQMKSVHFAFNGADCTYYGFWFGFGLMVSVFLLLSAIMAWTLGSIPQAHWSSVSLIAWSLVAAHFCNAVLSWLFFFAGPGILSTLIVGLLAFGCWRRQAHPVELVAR